MDVILSLAIFFIIHRTESFSATNCSRPTLDNTGTQLTISCEIFGVNILPLCSFFDEYNEKEIVYISEALYGEVDYWSHAEYFTSNCYIVITTSSLQPGSHHFYVNITQQGDVRDWFIVWIEPTIHSGDMDIEIAQTCPQSSDVSKKFIKAGTTAVCSCRKSIKNNTIGNVMWLYDNEIISTPGNLFSDLIVSYPEDFGKSFYCVGQHSKSKTTNVFQPMFAYGPTEIHISPQIISLDGCSSAAVVCWTPENNFFPNATFRFSTDNTSALNVSENGVKITLFNYTSVIKATLTGTYYVLCEIVNDVFDIHVNTSMTVIVKDRKESVPFIIANEGKIIAENDDVNIICYVKSSESIIRGLNLTCLGQSVIAMSNNVTLSQKITREHNGSVCTCVAEYSSECFKESSSSWQLYVVYGPSNLDVGKTFVTMEKCTPKTITCSVPVTDFYPSVTFECYADVPEAFNVQFNQINSTSSVSVNITALKVGSYIITCSAMNTKKNSYKVKKAVTVIVADLFSNVPVITLDARHSIVDGAKKVKISCVVAESSTATTNITFTCLGPPVTVYDTSVTVERNITRSNNGTICTCSVFYVLDCRESQTAIYEVIVPYGPTKVLSLSKYMVLNKCEPFKITFYTIESDNYPGSKFELIKDVSLQVVSNVSKEPSDFVHVVNLIGSKAGNFSIKGVATNLMYDRLTTETTVWVYIKENILPSPKLVINSGDIMNENLTSQTVNINCSVPVSKNTLSNLTLTCQNDTDVTNLNSISVYRSRDENGTDCICKAKYFDPCNGFNEMTSRFNIMCVAPVMDVNDNKPIIANDKDVNINITCKGIHNYNSDSSMTLTCLGDPVHITGSVVSINRSVSKVDNGAECICSIQSSLCMEKQISRIRLNISYDSGILNYSVNDETSVKIVNEGDQIRFVCKVGSNPKPIINLMTADGKVIANNINRTSEHVWELHYLIENATCMDTNVYVCSEHNELTMTGSKSSINVLVKCPPRLNSNIKLHREFHKKSSRSNLALEINLLSYPVPMTIELYFGLNREKVDNSSYIVIIKPINLPFISAVLFLYDLNDSKLTNYTLVIGNGIGQHLQYSFNLVPEEPADDDQTAVISLAITVGLLLSVLMLLGVCFFLKRRKNNNALNISKAAENESDSRPNDQTEASNQLVEENYLNAQNASSTEYIHTQGETYNDGMSDVQKIVQFQLSEVPKLPPPRAKPRSLKKTSIIHAGTDYETTQPKTMFESPSIEQSESIKLRTKRSRYSLIPSVNGNINEICDDNQTRNIEETGVNYSNSLPRESTNETIKIEYTVVNCSHETAVNNLSNTDSQKKVEVETRNVEETVMNFSHDTNTVNSSRDYLSNMDCIEIIQEETKSEEENIDDDTETASEL